MEIDEKILCSKVLHFKLPFPWNKKEATEECRKFGNAKISEVSTPSLANVSDQDLENIYGPYGEHFQECEFFWTPFTDEGTEGSFVHEITNENIRYTLHTSYTCLPGGLFYYSYDLIIIVALVNCSGLQGNQMVVHGKIMLQFSHLKDLSLILNGIILHVYHAR